MWFECATQTCVQGDAALCIPQTAPLDLLEVGWNKRRGILIKKVIFEVNLIFILTDLCFLI